MLMLTLPRSAAAQAATEQTQHPTSTAPHNTFRSRLKRSSRRVCCSPSLQGDRIGRACTEYRARTYKAPHTGADRAGPLSRPSHPTLQHPEATSTPHHPARSSHRGGRWVLTVYFGARYLPGSLALAYTVARFACDSNNPLCHQPPYLSLVGPTSLAGQTKDGLPAIGILPLHAGPVRHPERSGRSSPQQQHPRRPPPRIRRSYTAPRYPMGPAGAPVHHPRLPAGPSIHRVGATLRLPGSAASPSDRLLRRAVLELPSRGDPAPQPGRRPAGRPVPARQPAMALGRG